MDVISCVYLPNVVNISKFPDFERQMRDAGVHEWRMRFCLLSSRSVLRWWWYDDDDDDDDDDEEGEEEEEEEDDDDD